MFTGIITGVGRITAHHALGSSLGHGKRLEVAAPAGYLDDVQLGDSIAINGACMTVTSFDTQASIFTIDVSAESLSKTTGLDQLGPVNLEKALRANDRLGGHIVSGHVDGVGEVSINLIPHSISNTALGSLQAGSRVNLEIDLIARYVERMLGQPSTSAP